MSSYFNKRNVWISIVAILLVLSVLAFQWLLARGRALAVLEKEQATGLHVGWRQPSWAKDQPYLAKLWPWSYLAEVHVDHTIQDAAALGEALNHFDSVESLSVGHGDMKAIHLLLAHCGTQSRLKSLMLFNVEVDDRILPILAKWQTIERLAMVPNELTGEKFPLMPHLRSLDMSYSRINDAGLVQVTSCPQLKDLFFSSTTLTSASIIQAVRASNMHLRKLRMSDVELTDRKTAEDYDKLIKTVREVAPNLDFDF